jgi:hypothetical protein
VAHTGGGDGRQACTCDVLAVVDAAVDGAEGAAGDDAPDDELGGVDLPVLPPPAGGGLLLLLLRGPGAAEVALQLLVQALEVDLVRPHEAAVAASTAGGTGRALLHRARLMGSQEREARGGAPRKQA